MFSSSNSTPNYLALSTAIQQLDNIAYEIQDKKFVAIEQEEKPIQTILKVNKPSFNYLLAIHHCRIGYLFTKDEKWDEAVQHFANGLELFNNISKAKLEHAHIIFFSHVYLTRASLLKNLLNNREQAIQSYQSALNLMLEIKKDSQTLEDVAYQISYYYHLLLVEMDIDLLNVQTDETTKINELMERLNSFIHNVLLRPNIVNFNCNLLVESGDEANKARDIYNALIELMPELKQSSLQGNSIFKDKTLLRPRTAAAQDEKKTIFDYYITMQM
jgi:tetratricopeptide (TPR) repeat protein